MCPTGHLHIYQTPVTSTQMCYLPNTESTNSSSLCTFLHYYLPDFTHSHLQGHLGVFTILHGLPFWYHPPRQSFNPFLPTVMQSAVIRSYITNTPMSRCSVVPYWCLLSGQASSNYILLNIIVHHGWSGFCFGCTAFHIISAPNTFLLVLCLLLSSEPLLFVLVHPLSL